MYDDVLVPTDGGEQMEIVVEHALDIASQRGATVHALSVVDDRAFLTLDESLKTEVDRTLSETAEMAVAEVADAADAAGIDTVTAVRRGKPADEIARYADEADIDLIVVGARGIERYEQNMLGSVSKDVVSKAARPVLTVPLDTR